MVRCLGEYCQNDFSGFVVGGSLGRTKEEMYDIVEMTSKMLDKTKYVHLLGIGGIDDIFNGVNAALIHLTASPRRESRAMEQP